MDGSFTSTAQRATGSALRCSVKWSRSIRALAGSGTRGLMGSIRAWTGSGTRGLMDQEQFVGLWSDVCRSFDKKEKMQGGMKKKKSKPEKVS